MSLKGWWASMPKVLTPSQEQLVLGTMLGDAHLNCRSRHPSYMSNHGWCQHDYNTLKAQALSAFIRTPIKQVATKGYGKLASRFFTLTSPAFDSIQEVCCVWEVDRWVKRVSAAWLERLDWEGVAWWVGDDGTMDESGGFTFCTHGFSRTEVELLVTWLCDRGVPASIRSSKSTNNPGEVYWLITLNQAASRIFVEKIEAYVPNCMRYKIRVPPPCAHGTLLCLRKTSHAAQQCAPFDGRSRAAKLLLLSRRVSKDPRNPIQKEPLSGEARAVQGGLSILQQLASRRRRGAQASGASPRSCRKGADPITLRGLRGAVSARRSSQLEKAVSAVPRCEKAGDRLGRLPSVLLEKIEYVGEHEVWDIGTEKYNRFLANGIAVHNCQGIDPAFIPIILATLGACANPRVTYAGTPLTLDNTLEGRWQDSSMCEFFIKCHHCLEWNIPSTEYHALDMIGPWHEDISEENAGIICHKCMRPLRPRTGEWVPRHPERMGYNEGYHVPQILVPVHYKHPQKWRIIAGAKNGSMPVNVFYNEILGESYDVGAKLVTETDLRNACVLGFPNTPAAPSIHVLQRKDRYERTALGIDWGGGGEERDVLHRRRILWDPFRQQDRCPVGKKAHDA